MPNLASFAFDDSLVRTRLDDDGRPWFVAKDVCAVLELEKYRDAISRLDEDERGSAIVDTPGGPQEMSIVSESGLYSLIFRSRKPEARRFRKWVTAEVLPALRRTGTYTLGADERAALARVPELTKRTVVKELSTLARGNPARARTLEADILCLLAAMAPEGAAPASPAPQPELVTLFWRVYAGLEKKGVKVNHSAAPGLIAVNLPDFLDAASAEGFYGFNRAELIRALPYSRTPHFLQRRKVVRSVILHKAVNCWVFVSGSSDEAGKEDL